MSVCSSRKKVRSVNITVDTGVQVNYTPLTCRPCGATFDIPACEQFHNLIKPCESDPIVFLPDAGQIVEFQTYFRTSNVYIANSSNATANITNQWTSNGGTKFDLVILDTCCPFTEIQAPLTYQGQVCYLDGVEFQNVRIDLSQITASEYILAVKTDGDYYPLAAYAKTVASKCVTIRASKFTDPKNICLFDIDGRNISIFGANFPDVHPLNFEYRGVFSFFGDFYTDRQTVGRERVDQTNEIKNTEAVRYYRVSSSPIPIIYVEKVFDVLIAPEAQIYNNIPANVVSFEFDGEIQKNIKDARVWKFDFEITKRICRLNNCSVL